MTNANTPPVVQESKYPKWLFVAAGICFFAPIAAGLCTVLLLTSIAAVGASAESQFAEVQTQLNTPAIEQPGETIPTSVKTGLPVGPSTRY